MTEQICRYCGDGPDSIGTMNHIECVERLTAELAALDATAESLLARAERAEKALSDQLMRPVYTELAALKAENERLKWMLHRAAMELAVVSWHKGEDVANEYVAELEQEWAARDEATVLPLSDDRGGRDA